MSQISWSDEQNAIFGWFTHGTGNLVAVARAGCGKTTTIVEGVKRAPEAKKWVGAFGKKIKEELDRRFVGRRDVKVQTFHGLGYGYVISRWGNIGMCSGDERAVAITEGAIATLVANGLPFVGNAPDDVRKLVSKLHTKAREIAPHAKTGAELYDLAVMFECEPEAQWVHEGYDTGLVCNIAAEALRFASSNKPIETGIDFADMIFLPVRNRWMRGQFDLAVGDEAQDLTVAQLELMIGSVRPGGRVCLVGDDRQAIYAFRGADVNALSRLRAELNAAELGLKTTYRCSRAIVDVAADIVPDFVAGPDNPAGTVRDITADALMASVGYGDFILSRANAPLLPTAIALLRAGRRARIAGRDIGAGLKALIRKLARGAARDSVPAFIGRLGTWMERETARAMAIKAEYTRKAKLDYIRDQHGMLLELADGAVSVGAITAAIDALFTDDGLGDAGVVTLSSVHRAKGLEANRVFILADTMKYGEIEEDNIRYVAITRAKRELVWVGPAVAPMPGDSINV